LAIQCLLPILFDVRIKNYFFATIFGIVPGTFLIASIGSGLEQIINQNSEVPKIIDIIFTPNIYIPLIAFLALIFSTIILRKFFYKN